MIREARLLVVEIGNGGPDLRETDSAAWRKQMADLLRKSADEVEKLQGPDVVMSALCHLSENGGHGSFSAIIGSTPPD